MQAFRVEMHALGAEKAAQQAQAAEGALAEAQAELHKLQAAADELAEQEQQYWQIFNGFHLQLASHVEERDILLAQVGLPSSIARPVPRLSLADIAAFMQTALTRCLCNVRTCRNTEMHRKRLQLHGVCSS